MSLGCAFALQLSRALSTPHAKLASAMLLAAAKLARPLDSDSSSALSMSAVAGSSQGLGVGRTSVQTRTDATAARRVCVDSLWRAARVCADAHTV